MESEIVSRSLKESAAAKERFQTAENVSAVVEAASAIAASFRSGGKLLIVGNGGSAADAQHLAAEFVNRFEMERPPLPAIALTTDSSCLTSIGNDYSFDQVYSKQVRALGRKGDVLLAISTSGASRNVTEAVDAARSIGIKTVVLTGKGGGDLVAGADVLINVDSRSTPRIQEVHITVCHIICELVDHTLFKRV